MRGTRVGHQAHGGMELRMRNMLHVESAGEQMITSATARMRHYQMAGKTTLVTIMIIIRVRDKAFIIL